MSSIADLTGGLTTRMPRAWRYLAVVSLLPGPALAGQGLIGVSAGQGVVGLSAEGFFTGVSGTPTSRSGDFREWIQLPLTGALVDRALFSWSGTIQPTLQQRVQTGFDRTLAARQLNLAFLGRLLADRPVHLGVSASRTTSTATGGFGSRREGFSSQLGGELAWRNPYLPMQLSAFHRRTDERWQSTAGGTRYHTDQRNDAVRFSASNRKLSLEAQGLQVDDRVSGRVLEGRTLAGRHQVRWGKGSSLASTLEDYREEDGAVSRRSTWGEQLHLQHTRAIGTSWFFRRGTTRLGATRSLGTGWGGGADVRVFPWASLGLDGSRFTGETGPTRETYTSLTPRAGINLVLPGAGRLTASAAATREVRRRTGPVPQGIAVVGEAHLVPVARRITLDQLDVIAGSLEVRDPGGGILFVEGLDYTVTVAGSFTSLDLPPTGRIQVGDQLRVSYRYQPSATRAEAEGWRVDYEGTLRYRVLTIRHQRSRRDHANAATLVSAGADFDDRRTSAALRAATPAGQLDLEAAERRTDRFGQRSTERSLSGGLALPPVGAMQLSLSGAVNRLHAGPTEVTALSGLLALNAAPATWLRLQGGLEGYRWRQTGLADQRFLTARLAADATFGLLEAGLSVEQFRQEFVVTNLTRRLALRLLRRF